MIRFLRKLKEDRRGNALIVTGAALPLLVGAAGLGTDTVQWVLWKRELQRAADTGALAGAYAQMQTESVSTAVSTHITDNNHTGIALLTGYPQISYPADSGGYSKAVKVRLAMQKSLGFSSMFLHTPPTISAEATAGLVNDGSYCVVALNGTTNSSITIGGSTTVNMGCGAISNSTSPTAAVNPNGNAYNFTATPVAGVGGMPSSINGATNIQPHHVAMPDPFSGKYSTGLPAGSNCKSLAQNTYTTSTGTGQNKVTTNHLYSYETKGVCYSSFKFSGNQTYYMDPGTYYLDSTDFDTNGGVSLYGTGVTIILTGATPGSVQTNGNSTIQLSAPTSGTYKNMLIIGIGSGSQIINGNNTSFYDGAMYFPNGTATFSGSSGAMTQCAMVVANYVDFTGNSNVQNSLTRPDGTACSNATQVSGKAVRLIA